MSYSLMPTHSHREQYNHYQGLILFGEISANSDKYSGFT